MPTSRFPLLAALALVVVSPASARAFSLFPEFGGSSVSDTLSRAARWSSVTGLSDGIQVGIAPGVGEALAVDGDVVADVEQAILDGVAAWESPVLGFDIVLDAPGTVEGPALGNEIDVFAVPGSHPLFQANPQAFTGLAVPQVDFFADRPFTNGQSAPGYGISGADIYFNIDSFQLLAVLGVQRLDVLTRVTIHELGHALGFGHVNETTNYDTNTNPFDPMMVDPDDPFANVIVSPFFDQETVMSNEPCGPNPTAPCPGVFFTSLGNDELGGRDVLYPVSSVPEPRTGLLLTGALLFAQLLAQSSRMRSCRSAPEKGFAMKCAPSIDTCSGPSGA